ncbi:MAG: carboxypeptidase-like regulatory domain-containing protein, partial [Bacteroidales bacterium]
MKRITIFIVCLSFLGFNAFAQDIQITGKVTSAEDGSSLPGVSVTVKGTTTGTSTNIDGDYSLSAPSDATLVYSFVGMQTQEVPVGGQTTINVALDVESTTLDEIVVVGYGTKAKGSVTGSVGLVKAEEIEQSAIASFDQALQGKVTGVQVLNSSGRPGAEAIVRIRGISTVNATTDP